MARAKRCEGSVPGWQTIGGLGSPWQKANEGDRLRALAVVEQYAQESGWTTADLAGAHSCPEHMIRQAPWLALASGLLERKSGGGFLPSAKGRREIAA